MHAIDAPGLRRRRRGTRGAAVDHDRRRQARWSRRSQPCWEAMGKTIIHQGGPGAGQHTKMVNQMLIASEHDRRLRGAALRLQGGPRPDRPCCNRSLPARRAAGRSRTSARGSSPTTSIRASSSSTSSRTWASPWTKPAAWACRLPGLALAQQLYIGPQGARPRPRRHARAGAGPRPAVGNRLAEAVTSVLRRDQTWSRWIAFCSLQN